MNSWPATSPKAEVVSRAVTPVSIFDPVRLVGVHAQPALAVGLVVGIVALEPHHLRIALKGECGWRCDPGTSDHGR